MFKTVKEQKNECCGCTACANICPQNAIVMKADDEGFLYPHINETQCIQCNLCHSVCDFSNPTSVENPTEAPVYALRLSDEEELWKSQSGGAFTAFAQYILKKEGVVYGAAFTDGFRVVHLGINSIADLQKLRGTKYVQSDLGKIYSEIENKLREKEWVLFSGTPCQVAGLLSFLKHKKDLNQDRLYTCDIICHGVPSPLIWEKEVEHQCEKGNLVTIKFRNKENGWRNNISTFIFSEKKANNDNVFNTLYANGLITRPSCAKCKYACIKRISDITIGDYWGIENINTKMDDGKGCSVVIINNQNGMKLIKAVAEYCNIEKGNIASCNQPQLHKPMTPHWNRNHFWTEYRENGYLYVRKKYAENKSGKIRKLIIKILNSLGLMDSLVKVLKTRS